MTAIPNKFATRKLVLVYKTCQIQNETLGAWKIVAKLNLEILFGAVYDQHNSSYLIFVSASCSFDEINAAVWQKFANNPILKGLRYRLQLQDDMVVV